MKKVIGFLALGLIIVLGSYNGMGYLTERKLKEQVRVLHEANGVQLNVARYDRGWFTSDALFNWQLHVPGQTLKINNELQTIPAKDFNIPLAARIHHGPIMWTDGKLQFGLGALHSLIKLPKEYLVSFNKLFSDTSIQPQLLVDFFLSYLGNAKVRADLPAFRLTTKEDHKHFEWLGGKATTKIAANMNHVKGFLDLQGLNATVDHTSLQGEKAQIQYDLHRTAQNLFLGSVNVFLPVLKVQDGNKSILAVEDFHFDSDADIKKGLFDTRLKLSLKTLGIEQKQYGPSKLDVVVKNLNADALTQLNEKLEMAQQGSEVQRKTALLSMIAPLSQLLGKGAELSVNEFLFTMPEGMVKGNLQISLPKGIFDNLVEFTKKIQGNGKLTLPAVVMRQWLITSIQEKMMSPQGMVEKSMISEMEPAVNTKENARLAAQSTDLSQQVNSLADAQLATMIRNGLLKPEGADYVLEASLSAGKFTINGKPFDPDMMKF